MKKDNLKNFINGWFIGNFNPSLLLTDNFEIAVKRYKAGNSEKSHVHKIATEYTIIIDGEVEMNKNKYLKDDIIIIEPNNWTDFYCLTDVTTLVIKIPSVKEDKYFD
jgi:quercetin dioxygenase-like cupin family protein